MHLQGLEGINGLCSVVLPGPNLAVAPALDDREIADVVRSLALTLAEVHERGYVHGNVEASRVVLDADGAPVLSGAELCQPSDDPSDDVAQWGVLVAHLLQWGAAADGAGFDRPRTRRRRRPVDGESDDVRLVLSELADQAQQTDSALRPTARALATAICHRLPDGRRREPPAVPTVLPTNTPDRWTPWLQKLGGRRAIFIAGGIAGGIVGAAVLVAAVPALFESSPATPAPGSASRATPPSSTECPPVAPPAADADADGCEEPVTIEEGVLVVGSLRFALGSGEDQVVVGDWDCDGRRTPGLLIGPTAVVYDDWPERGAETSGRVVASVPGATTIAVTDSGPCELLVITSPNDPPRILDPRPAP